MDDAARPRALARGGGAAAVLRPAPAGRSAALARRAVIVANRVPAPGGRQPGGLAVTLRDALTGREALWFGWSGATVAEPDPAPRVTEQGPLAIATLDLEPGAFNGYYAGFANGTLWPVLHYRLGLAKFDRHDYACYRSVNERLAHALMPLLRDDDLVWAHDFHLIPFGAALRGFGARQRLGFYLHVPFPPPAVFSAVPWAEELLWELTAYDVIGVQTEMDRRHLSEALLEFGHEEAASRVKVYPAGIDFSAFAQQAARAAASGTVSRLVTSLGKRALIFGVDRLDYTKGLPHRFMGYGQLLARFPRHRGRATYLQIAPLSRIEVSEYRDLKSELDELAGRVNGQYAELDWVPIRWITRPFSRPTLAGIMRAARVGLVTPLRDGMNLVAKEFVAAQDPDDPGVLVLSRFAGAAESLQDAVLVNPHDPDELAEALDLALTMPLDQRRARWQAMAEAVRRDSAKRWGRSFLEDLEAA
ncbi:MAG TPA: trehalose-6-phosphate synthase [Acetobacteraceae bacterium]|nr:trehalose-6-phosphate synthase [Acetobacteraceae bacterium]